MTQRGHDVPIEIAADRRKRFSCCGGDVGSASRSAPGAPRAITGNSPALHVRDSPRSSRPVRAGAAEFFGGHDAESAPVLGEGGSLFRGREKRSIVFHGGAGRAHGVLERTSPSRLPSSLRALHAPFGLTSHAASAGSSRIAPSMFTTNRNVSMMPMSAWNLSGENTQVTTPIASVMPVKMTRCTRDAQRVQECLVHVVALRAGIPACG